jgi:hypothetical protein
MFADRFLPMSASPDHVRTAVSSDDIDHRLSEQAARHLATAESLRRTAWELSAAGLRAFRPELQEHEVQDEVRRLFRCAAG